MGVLHHRHVVGLQGAKTKDVRALGSGFIRSLSPSLCGTLAATFHVPCISVIQTEIRRPPEGVTHRVRSKVTKEEVVL